MGENDLRRKNEVTVNPKTGRFHNVDSAVIISSTVLLKPLMMTAESMVSKHLFFLLIAILFC